MVSRSLMFQGTGSDVGKSTLVAGLCRLAHRRGIRVAPFKPQNMSNNAAACADGGEIGRAQALQARACGLAPCVDFNPVLLKPQDDSHAQVIVHGRVAHSLSARDYMQERRQTLMQAVLESHDRLAENHDLILIEGAGSAAEVNLRKRDIANMGFARRRQVPVCLIGDIDRGGVIAAMAGTRVVIDSRDAALVRSFIINRFRGDPDLFVDGVQAIVDMTGWTCRGVVPWLPSALQLPSEDAVVLEQNRPAPSDSTDRLRIAVPMLSRIANFDDMDPLRLEPHVDLGFVPPGKPIPRDIDAIILPGTKSTLADLAFVRAQGWDHDIIAFARAGGQVTGLCGGYQLLGRTIDDPHGSDGKAACAEGLGLLDMHTLMLSDKRTRPVQGHCPRSGHELSGYEIHVGTSSGPDTRRPMTLLEGEPDGAVNVDGTVEGSYLHGLFANDAYRAWWLNRLRQGTAGQLDYEARVETALDALADGLEAALDVDALFDDARPTQAAEDSI